MNAVASKYGLHSVVKYTAKQRDKLLWREWSGRYAPRPRFDPEQIILTLHAARTSHARAGAFRDAAAVVNALATDWDIREVRLDPRNLRGTADRAAAVLIDSTDKIRTPWSAASRAMLLEVLLSIEQFCGSTASEVIHPDPFAPSRLALQPPWSEAQILDRLETLILEVGDAVLRPEWLEVTLTDAASDLWPHALVVAWAKQSGRFARAATAAQHQVPRYVRACAEDGADMVVKMLARLGFIEFAKFMVGSAIRIVDESRHPVAVQLLHPQPEPSWWAPACRDLIHLASCRQLAIARERWTTERDDSAIAIEAPAAGWMPEHERSIADCDVSEDLPY
jgi:hypothetical protein